jgi:hypothetical protein
MQKPRSLEYALVSASDGKNGGTLEHAQQIAAHESPRATRPSVLGGEWSMLSGRRLLCNNH